MRLSFLFLNVAETHPVAKLAIHGSEKKLFERLFFFCLRPIPTTTTTTGNTARSYNIIYTSSVRARHRATNGARSRNQGTIWFFAAIDFFFFSNFSLFLRPTRQEYVWTAPFTPARHSIPTDNTANDVFPYIHNTTVVLPGVLIEVFFFINAYTVCSE